MLDRCQSVSQSYRSLTLDSNGLILASKEGNCKDHSLPLLLVFGYNVRFQRD